MATRKARYAAGFKPQVMRGKPLMPNAGSMARYDARLRMLIDAMTNTVDREIKELFRSEHAQQYFAQDASVSSQARMLMARIRKQFEDLFGFKAQGIANDFAKDADKSSAASLKVSLRQLSAGLTLKTDFFTQDLREILNATIAENVALIKSIPQQYFTDIQGAVYRSITTGNGLADLVPALKKYEAITIKRARLIAHDQTRKAFSNINRARLEKIGIKKFEWLHSAGGQQPRPLHKDVLNHQIFSWDNLPVADERTGERCGPGVLINCRCVAIPVIDFETDDFT